MHKRLLQLLKDNAQRNVSALKIENADEDAVIYLYDVIDPYFGIGAADFSKELAALKGKAVQLRINSPGGDVFDGRAIATAISQHGNVTAYIDGIAASAATYVALAAKEVHIAEGGFFMIHNAWTFAYGNKHDLERTAELLDKVDGSIKADYMKKTGKDETEISALMDAETWFTADEALEAGFVDSVFDGTTAQDKAWNLSAYENAPKALTEQKQPPIENEIGKYRDTAERRLRLLQVA